MTFSATATKSGNPTVVVVTIGFRKECRPADIEDLMSKFRNMSLACAGPTPGKHGDRWEVYLTQSDVPDTLQDLEDMLWDAEWVRQSVVTFLPPIPPTSVA